MMCISMKHPMSASAVSVVVGSKHVYVVLYACQGLLNSPCNQGHAAPVDSELILRSVM